nr:hypothetical protein [uncultured Albidiferax sp.]
MPCSIAEFLCRCKSSEPAAANLSLGQGQEQIYAPGGIDIWILDAIWAATAIACLLTIVALHRHWKQPASNGLLKAMWVFWVVVPPVWFAFEYFWLFKSCGNSAHFEAFKYGQDIASKVWLGIVVLLSGILKM